MISELVSMIRTGIELRITKWAGHFCFFCAAIADFCSFGDIGLSTI
jgi:hypothetical protein